MSIPLPNSCPAGTLPCTVKPGDTLYGIAQNIGVTVDTILSLNPGINPDFLRVGQSICIPGRFSNCSGGKLYNVQPGDTLYNIAAHYGITLSSLITANPGLDPNRLIVGQTICIPTPTPSYIATPCSLLLQPVFNALPPGADIPIGSIALRQVAMSTRSFTVVASALPPPRSFGNYDSYIALLYLVGEDLGQSTLRVRLVVAAYGNQRTTWSGESTGVQRAAIGSRAEIRPYSDGAGVGNTVLQGDFSACCRG